MTERKKQRPHKNPKTGGQGQGRDGTTESRISHSLKNNYPPLQRFQVRIQKSPNHQKCSARKSTPKKP